MFYKLCGSKRLQIIEVVGRKIAGTLDTFSAGKVYLLKHVWRQLIKLPHRPQPCR